MGFLALMMASTVYLLLFCMAGCMLASAVGGLLLRLCVGPVRKDGIFEQHFPGFAGRAAGIGLAGIVAGVAGAAVFVTLVLLSMNFFLAGEIALWVCTALCVVCGVQLLLLAKKLRWVIGMGAPYATRRVACMVCGIITLGLALPGVVLGVFFIVAPLLA